MSAISRPPIKIIKVEQPNQLEDAYAVRLQVFIKEQRVPIEEEIDEYDEKAHHWVAYDMSVPSSPRPVGTVRLVVYPSQSGKLGRLAVIQSHRGLGIGRQLMLALHEYVKTSSLRRVFMHAQVDKIDFYKKLGYSVYDANEFDECGIMHVKMDQSFPAVV